MSVFPAIVLLVITNKSRRNDAFTVYKQNFLCAVNLRFIRHFVHKLSEKVHLATVQNYNRFLSIWIAHIKDIFSLTELILGTYFILPTFLAIFLRHHLLQLISVQLTVFVFLRCRYIAQTQLSNCNLSRITIRTSERISENIHTNLAIALKQNILCRQHRKLKERNHFISTNVKVSSK